MKKIVILITVFLMTVGLVSCATESNTQIKETGATTFINNTEQSETIEPTIDYPLIDFETLNELEKYLQENEMPSDFVTYDMLSVFGDFDGLVILENALKPPYQYKEYMYSFLNVEQRFSMYVYHDYEKEKDPHYVELPTISEMPSEDMRYAPEGVTRGCYYVNDMEFGYVNGGLYWICWYGKNNVYFSFVFEDFGRDKAYDIDNELIKGLLNQNTIEASKAALDTFMNEKSK